MRSSPPTIAVVLAALIFAGCSENTLEPRSDLAADQFAEDSPTFRATSVHEPFIADFDIPAFGPLDCLGETVHWTGTVTFEDHIVTRPDGTVHFNSKGDVNPGSTMVGVISGTWSNPRVVNHFVDEGNVFHVNERIRWTNQATGQTMDVWTRFFLANGAVVIDTGGPTCRLRN